MAEALYYTRANRIFIRGPQVGTRAMYDAGYSMHAAQATYMIGDVLLTGERIGDIPAQIPSVAEDSPRSLQLHSTLNRVPRGTRQKIAVCSDKLILGWSGDRDRAIDVITRIRNITMQSPESTQPIGEFLDSLPEQVRGELRLVGFFLDNGGVLHDFQFGSDIHTIPTTRFGQVTSLGRGARVAGEVRSDLDCALTDEHFPQSDEELGRDALIQSVHLASLLLLEDLTDGESIKNQFGGAYEIAALMDNRFQKLDDFTLVYWNAEICETGLSVAQKPDVGFRISYWEDVLTVRSFAAQPDGPYMCKLNCIDPVYERDEYCNDLITPPSFDAALIVNCIKIIPAKGSVAHVILDCGRDKSPVRFKSDGASTVPQIDESFFEEVVRNVNQLSASADCDWR